MGKSLPASAITAAHKFLTGQGEYRKPAWSLWGSSDGAREIWKPVLDEKEKDWGDNNPKGSFENNRVAVQSAVWKDLFPRQDPAVVEMFTAMATAPPKLE